MIGLVVRYRSRTRRRPVRLPARADLSRPPGHEAHEQLPL
jgi:hypothetical protein